MGKAWSPFFMKKFLGWQNWIFGTFWPLDCWGHFKQFWGHFGALLGPFWDNFGTISDQFVARNSNLSQTSLLTTQNDRKRSRILMEIVLRLNFKTFRSFRGVEWHQMTTKWPPKLQKSAWNSLYVFKVTSETISVRLGYFLPVERSELAKNPILSWWKSFMNVQD